MNDDEIVAIATTRGQPLPKNDCKDWVGQEGPRTHVVTTSGKLYISGTCHKGLGCNHIYKVLINSKYNHCQFRKRGSVEKKIKYCTGHDSKIGPFRIL